MSGFDLILKDAFSLSQIREGLAAACGVPKDCVVAIDGYPEDILPPGTQILSMRTDAGGDFQTHLSIELMTLDSCESSTLIAMRLSEILSSDCLLPDIGDNPYSMNLISPGVPMRNVLLRADDLDDGEYRLIE